jgi:hypothetical protein
MEYVQVISRVCLFYCMEGRSESEAKGVAAMGNRVKAVGKLAGKYIF